MAIQYVSDDTGNPTAVLVPIIEWKRLHSELENLKEKVQGTVKPISKRKPSEFAGTLSKEDAEKFIKYVEESRNEWERNF